MLTVRRARIMPATFFTHAPACACRNANSVQEPRRIFAQKLFGTNTQYAAVRLLRSFRLCGSPIASEHACCVSTCSAAGGEAHESHP